MIADIEPELMGIYNNGVRGGGGSTATGITVSGTMPSATTTTEGAVQTCNTSTAVTSESVSLVPTQYLFQTEIARLENAIVTAGGTVEPSGGGTQPSISISGATLESAGIVKTCIASNAQVTSETYDVVPTQYYLQKEVARLENAISSANSTTVYSSSIISSSVVSASAATLQNAGIVTTCNTSNGDVTSETVAVVPTQYFVQSEITRLDNRINTSGGGGTASIWADVTDLGSAATATLEAGSSYKLDASSGTHSITAVTSDTTKIGADGRLLLNAGDLADLTIQAPLAVQGTLQANALNVCTVKFCNGRAYILPEFHLSVANNYTVTITTGTTGDADTGSLFYGLQLSVHDKVAFDPATNGSACDMQNAVLNDSKTIVGNGKNQTIVSGGADCTASAAFSEVQFSGAQVLGGTAVLEDTRITSLANSGAIIFSGSNEITGTVSGTGTINLASGASLYGGGSMDLGHAHNLGIAGGASVTITDMTITNCSGGNAGVVYISQGQGVRFSSCTISGNSGNSGGVLFLNYRGTAQFTDCNIVSNTCNKGGVAYCGASTWLNFSNCVLKDNVATGGGGILNVTGANGKIYFTGCTLDGTMQVAETGSVCLSGSNLWSAGYLKPTTKAFLYIESGGTLNLTGNAGDTNGLIASAGSGIFVGTRSGNNWTVGGTATVINSAGEAVTIQGSGTTLSKDGTLS